MTDPTTDQTYVALMEEYLERTFGHQPDRDGDASLSDRYLRIDEATKTLARAILHTVPPIDNCEVLVQLRELRDSIRAAIHRAHFP